jgi:hypothetical protein
MDGSTQSNAQGMRSPRLLAGLARRAIGALILAAGTGIGISAAYTSADALIGSDQTVGSTPTRVQLSLATALTSIGNSR